MEKRNRIALISSAAILSFVSITMFSFSKINEAQEVVDVKENNKVQYKWFPPSVPSKASFAGEPVPLDRWEVKERLDRELLVNYYMHGTMMYIMKLSNRMFPTIERILKENGVPDDFKYLCVAESNLQNLTSRAGAQGYWQFMNATAPSYGLEVNGEVDERYHLEKSTKAACIYFKQAYAKFGTWTAAAASYNCGMGGYNSQVTFQGSNNYYDLQLPEETNRYIFRILAFKTLLSAAQSWGFWVQGSDTYSPLKTRKVEVTTSIPNLASFAREQGSSYKILKLLNPWLHDRKLTVKPGKTYEIEFPQ